ncbi:MAG TPA: DUF4290 domain-containing protein [Bacteroidales bacterium]|jgi:hypothetical protein|nr:DUF4290 domain-containing protein [Bacteroidales bacterium]MDI9533280.1 DUF4290 domain-containing protein [Bacteroidota bacterium]MBK7733305.1 DUF4290 domain-containing protein [Bacteroidales bacterium]MBP7036398.1 DUF4290 domain-containing protein [Bacteroidales bacterium]MBP8709472.1 DUF4290 domain-containing protein [Bacteroidales bacterium]
MNFDYNTQRKRMALPEYGRNVLKMIEHAKTIKDPEERNRAAKTIIQIMGNLNPNLREVTDFKHKLWDHIMIIADFDLDVDSPYPAPDRKKLNSKPNKVPYHNGEIKYSHYGCIIPAMIEAAAKMKDGEEKDYLTSLILNQMKKDYVTWNKSTVADEVIIRDLIEISGNRLKVPENYKMPDVRDLIAQPKGKTQGKHQGRSQGRSKQNKKKHKNGY